MSISSFSYLNMAVKRQEIYVLHIYIYVIFIDSKHKKIPGINLGNFQMLFVAYLLNSATLKEQAPRTLKIAAKIAPIPKE